MINRVILVGNLAQDPQVKPTSTPVTELRLATSYRRKDAAGEQVEETEFHNIVTFGRQAEIAAEHFSKGQRIYVEGRLKTREYTSSDGSQRRATEIVAETVKILSDRRDPVGV